MQFTADQTEQTLWQRLSSQPHRLFFASSLLWGVILMSFSMGSYIGMEIDFSSIHGNGLLYGLFVNAFLGFLSTVIPRYSQSQEISRKTYLSFWLFYQMGLALWFIGFHLAGQALTGLALMTIGFIYFRTIRTGGYPNEPDSLWLAALLFVSGIILVLQLFFSFSLQWTGIWVTVLPITFTVAQRMIPFFYAGYFRSHYNKPGWVVPFFVLGSWGIALGGGSSLLTSLLGFVLSLGTAYFLWTLDIYWKAPAILRILTLGLLWLPVGLFMIGVESFWEVYTFKMGIHILLLGFIFTLLIGFGTRVLLGHSGQKIIAERITIVLFTLTQLVVIFRVIASLLFTLEIQAFVPFVHLGFTLFILLLVIWGIKYRKAIF
ncbi:MAG: NnrS family protein [Sulfurimonas sp.]